MGPLMGPVLGPIAGGYITQAFGWRWSFWALAIMGAITSVLCVVFLKETYAKTILERKAARLRKKTGDNRYVSIRADMIPSATLLMNAFVRPLKMLLFSPIVLLLSIYLAVAYGYLYVLLTTFTALFTVQYHFTTGTVGLTYIGLGVGFLIGVIISALASDKILLALTAKGDGTKKPEYRLPLMVWSRLITPVGLFAYGWTAEYNLHFIFPILSTMLVGIGLLLIMMPLQTYLIDAYTKYAASALAASTILRCLLGAILPLAGQPLYNALGLGWGNSLFGFITLVLVPVPFLLSRFGERLRKRFPVNFD